ncbi:hypothetical protein EHQ12_00790 [Leptospira gomenensis]|uniref:Lipoprotein n=1 Tax=Leptospira gomenensis TaxID=2484974 RepID=A0A5F1YYV8_9LEPT|nr:hypothetical protein [Leptospira gomenensis]TGK39229.1 hypothetical protein EHQ17_00690 [Leptospira gomenensis]TGK44231.1 hypothetical protein EHQ07_12015 [Leptospira gomenensis]TGK45100.1 hypothetical protein EHQ12_00790 [Leptospira gomenensis]TGK65093.1 hypothetical protein EHQ13_05990 [Leptospira gomenensis]
MRPFFNTLILLGSILGATLACSSKSPSNEMDATTSTFALLFGSSVSQNSSFFPAEIQSVSPEHNGRFASSYTEAGVHYTFPQCQSAGVFSLEKVVPQDVFVAEAVFKENISSGTISVTKLGIPVAGSVTQPDAKTLRFVSDLPGDLYQKYRVVTSDVKLALDGKPVLDATWFFYYDLNGDRGASPNRVGLTCSDASGTNVCNFESTYQLGRLNDGTVNPQSVFDFNVDNFRTDVGIQGSGGGFIYVWSYELCESETAGIPPKASGEFLFGKMTGTVPWEIPRAVVEANDFYVGSMTQFFRNVVGQRYDHSIHFEEAPPVTAAQQ